MGIQGRFPRRVSDAGLQGWLAIEVSKEGSREGYPRKVFNTGFQGGFQIKVSKGGFQ